MKRIFLIGLLSLAALVAAVAVIGPAPSVSAEQPPVNECPPGNLVAGKGCKWDLGFHEITSVAFAAYRVPDSDSCFAGFEFSPYDYESDLVGVPIFSGASLYYGTKTKYGQVQDRERDKLFYSDLKEVTQPGDGSLIIRSGPPFTLGSEIPSALAIESTPPHPQIGYTMLSSEIRANGYIRIMIWRYSSDEIIKETGRTPWLPIPSEVNDFSDLVFECLESIRREREHQALQEDLRAKNAAEQRAADMAAADAEAKAELQQIELEAAKQIQKKALETELFKTQALRSQLEQEKLIIAAWNTVVEIRLDGAQERAKITNAFMSEVEADKAAFVASVQAKVEELRRLQELNETLRTAIQAHNQTILDELAIQQALEEKQKQAIQDLEVKPSANATPSTPSN